MRKVLLTSGQVSVLASSAMVVLCTLALFLSGYSLQQRTLQELRSAIRPREPPKAHLPSEFKRTTDELEDVVMVESEAERWTREARSLVVEVKPSDAAMQTEETTQEETPGKDGKHSEAAGGPSGKPTKAQLAMAEKIKTQAAAKSWAVENPDPLSKNRTPLTRAERRKMIKEEIQKLSQSDSLIYYQRRLW